MILYYRYKTGDLVSMYKNIGQEKMKTIVENTTMESFKSEVGKMDIFLLPVSQDTIRARTLDHLRAKMAGYQIVVTELKITNYDWSDAFDAQIAAPIERAQQVKQKEQELLITEQEAQKQVKLAEANKTAVVLTAEGNKEAARLDAEAMVLKGEGIRKFNESVQKNMELEIALRKLDIEKLRVTTWNGQYVPVNNYGPIPVQTGGLQPTDQK
jgi:regulator of protease activity HflC (stomatin/prohibitin superfamily)